MRGVKNAFRRIRFSGREGVIRARGVGVSSGGVRAARSNDSTTSPTIRRRLLLVSATLAVFAAVPAIAATVTVVPTKDNTLQPDNPGPLSNGTGISVFVGRTNQSSPSTAISYRRGVVAFDVAGSIPAGATITSATLTMYSDAPGINGDRVVGLYRTLADWGEGSSNSSGGGGVSATNNDATWIYRFYNSTTPGTSAQWTTQGGDFASAASATALVLSAKNRPSWSSSGMVADLQFWLDHPTSNFGWTVVGDESVAQTAKQFASREYGTAADPLAIVNGGTDDPADRPTLVISYSVPEPAGLTLGVAAIGLLARRRRYRKA